MFTKKERQIYRYYNGNKVVGCDPMLVQMKLAKYTDWQTDIKLLQLVNQESLAAYERLTGAARVAFNVKSFSEEDGEQSGLLDQEVMELLVDFSDFVKDIKKKPDETQSKPNVGDSELSSGDQ